MKITLSRKDDSGKMLLHLRDNVYEYLTLITVGETIQLDAIRWASPKEGKV